MPLARRRIGSSFEYGHPDLYQNSQADTMLQDVTMASSTGTLAQIVDCYRPSPFYVGGLDAVGAPARDAFASTRTRA